MLSPVSGREAVPESVAKTRVEPPHTGLFWPGRSKEMQAERTSARRQRQGDAGLGGAMRSGGHPWPVMIPAGPGPRRWPGYRTAGL